jgi:hypothetical protein
MMFLRRADAAKAEKIKCCLRFAISSDSLNKQEITTFRDPLGLELFRRVATQLRSEGFQVTNAKPGKACVAAFKVRFPQFSVFAMLRAHRPTPDIVQCKVDTWCLRAIWHRASSQLVSEGWISLCAAIERILRQDLKVMSLICVTKNEARALDHEAEAMTPDSEK